MLSVIIDNRRQEKEWCLMGSFDGNTFENNTFHIWQKITKFFKNYIRGRDLIGDKYRAIR